MSEDIHKDNQSKTKKSDKESSKNELDKSWKEYNAALKLWKESLSNWQNATNEILNSYNNACKKALESDSGLLKKISASWEDTWDEIGPEYVKQQTKMFENIFKQTNVVAMKKFNEQWEKFLKTSGEDSIKAYQDAIKRFNSAWTIK